MKRVRVTLTPRQREVVAAYVTGATAPQVAEQLGIDYATVRTHIDRAKALYRAAGVDVGTKIALAEAFRRNTAA